MRKDHSMKPTIDSLMYSDRPALSRTLKWGPFVFAGYVLLLTESQAPALSSVTAWIELWAPLVSIMSTFLPVFETVRRDVSALASPQNVALIQHIFLLGWILIATVLPWSWFALCSVPRNTWQKIRKIYNEGLAYLVVILFGVALPFLVYFLATGDAYHSMTMYHRGDERLLILAALFWAVIYFAWAIPVTALTLAMSGKAAQSAPSSDARYGSNETSRD
jgi:hypothetical protein